MTWLGCYQYASGRKYMYPQPTQSSCLATASINIRPDSNWVVYLSPKVCPETESSTNITSSSLCSAALKIQLRGPLAVSAVNNLYHPDEQATRQNWKFHFWEWCPHKNEIPAVQVMFEEREEATQKHVSLQRWKWTVCKQGRKSGKIEENRESENIS